jgi:hypothetical protein
MILDLDRVRMLVSEGHSAVEIGRLLTISPKTVRAACRKHSIPLVNERRHFTGEENRIIAGRASHGWTATMIAREIGRDRQAVASRARKLGLTLITRPRPRYSAQEKALLEDAIKRGWGSVRIARVLGRSRDSICRKAAEIGARFRKRRSPKRHRLLLTLDRVLHERLLAAASIQGASPAAVARNLIREALRDMS